VLFRGGLRDCEDVDEDWAFELEADEDVGEGDWLALRARDALVGAGVDSMSKGDWV
jgi:hypothetical protein